MATKDGLYGTIQEEYYSPQPPKKLQESLELLNLRPALYILIPKAVIYNISRKFEEKH